MKNQTNQENFQKIFKYKFEELLLHIKCPCCNNFFIDSYRPYLLKCGHNICSKCICLNKNHYNCLICLHEYSKEELNTNNLPMNFIIDEIIHKMTTNKIFNFKMQENVEPECHSPNAEINKIFYCVRCNTLMNYTILHQKLFGDHTILDYEKITSKQDFKLFRNIRKIKRLNTQELIKFFISDNTIFMINNMKLQFKDIIDNFSNLENNLDITDVPTNHLDMMKILDLLLENERDKLTKAFLNECSGLDYYDKKLTKDECENILDTHIIVKNKFPELKNKIKDISQLMSNIKNDRFTEELAYEVSNFLKNIFYSDIKNHPNTQLCSFRIVDDKFLKIKIYDSLMDQLFDIQIYLPSFSGLENSKENEISVCPSNIDRIYISRGNFIYSVKLDKDFKIKKITRMPDFNISRTSHLSLYYDLNLFIIGGDEHNKKIEYYDCMSKNWINLPDLPIYESPTGLSHFRAIISDNKIFIFDRLRKCFYLDYLETNHKWQEIFLKYDDSFNLDLFYYCIILDSKNKIKINQDISNNYIFKFVGGSTIDSIDDSISSYYYNTNIYVFDYLSGTISLDKSKNLNSQKIFYKMIFKNCTSINKSESVNNQFILLGEDYASKRLVKLIYFN